MESFNVAIEKSDLHDWVERETRALDVVASWETLCDVYRTLEFTDPISDDMKMKEFQWIIAEMNKHLKRARNKLFTCQDPQSMRDMLANMFISTNASITNRMNLTYHKLRQMWVSNMIAKLDAMMMETMESKMKGESEDGRDDFWND